MSGYSSSWVRVRGWGWVGGVRVRHRVRAGGYRVSPGRAPWRDLTLARSAAGSGESRAKSSAAFTAALTRVLAPSMSIFAARSVDSKSLIGSHLLKGWA